jgi:hypothetical protein
VVINLAITLPNAGLPQATVNTWFELMALPAVLKPTTLGYKAINLSCDTTSNDVRAARIVITAQKITIEYKANTSWLGAAHLYLNGCYSMM